MRSRCCPVCVCVCVCISPLLTFERLNQSLLNLVRISQHLSPSQRLIKKSLPLVCVSVFVFPYRCQVTARFGKNPPIVARQWLGRNVIAVTNTHATIEELLDTSFSMRSLSYQETLAISSSQNVLFPFCAFTIFDISLIIYIFILWGTYIY
jgi:hypothetical protein